MIGRQILHYKITSLIGEGGMATVYEAIHDKLETKVAIKVLNPILTVNDSIRKRFLQEARLIASLNHPNIVKVIDYEEQNDFLAIVMEYLDGSDLSDFIRKNGKLPINQSVALFGKVLDAFSYAHSRGIVHRDVKPSNIFLTEGFEPKILDFGIARLIENDAALTHTGAQMGTPVYMSPELVNADKNIDQRSDIYSLGVTLYYLLRGEPPYDATTTSNFQIFNKIYTEPVPLLPGIPDFINQAIQKATAKKPVDRFQDCAEFKTVLTGNSSLPGSASAAGKTLPDLPAAEKRSFADDKTLIDHDASINPNQKPTVSTENKPIENKKETSDSAEHHPKRKNKLIYILGGVIILAIITVIMIKFSGEPSSAELDSKLRQDSIRMADSVQGATLKLRSDSISVAENLKTAELKTKAADSVANLKASEIIWTDKIHGSFTDTRDGQKYKVIKIGRQVWMAENLNFTTPSGSWCYENNSANCGKYGRLYTWDAARKAVPQGWHLPTTKEQETLIQDLYEKYAGESYPQMIKGGSTGFDVLLSGQLDENKKFAGMGTIACFWSSSPSANYATWAYYVYFDHNRKEIYYTSGERKAGYCVRCIKN